MGYGLVVTDASCKARFDSTTLAGTFECSTTSENGVEEFIFSTSTFEAASATVADAEGSVVDFGLAGLFIVSETTVTPLDDLAAQTLPDVQPIDDAMPAIAKRSAEFDGGVDPWRVLAGAFIGAAGLVVIAVLIVTARRNRRFGAA